MENIRKFPVHPQEKTLLQCGLVQLQLSKVAHVCRHRNTDKKTAQVRGNFKKQLEKKKNLK